MATYYLTGITGFLGHALVRAITSTPGNRVVGLAMRGDPGIKYYEGNKDVTIVEGDLNDLRSMQGFVKGIEDGSYVIHAAGRVSVLRRDRLAMHINYGGTQTLVSLLKDKPLAKFVYVSSVDALPQQREGYVSAPRAREYLKPEDALGDYGKSKVWAANFVLWAHKERNLPAVVVCPSAIIGPDDPLNAPMNDVLKRFAKGKIPVATPGGYDVVDVDDVAKGILLACEKGVVGETYLLTGHRVEVKELFAVFSKVTGVKAPRFTLPFWVLYMVAPFAVLIGKLTRKRPLFSPLAIDCLRINPHYDRNKTEDDLGYEVSDLEDTVRRTYRWQENQAG